MVYTVRDVDETRPSEFTLASILGQFGIVDWSTFAENSDDIELQDKLIHGTAQKVLVHSESESLILRQLPWYLNDEARALAICELLVALRSKGLPVPKLRFDNSGSPLVSRISNGKKHLYTMHQVVPGGPVGESNVELYRTGRILAEYHEVQMPPNRFQKIADDDVFSICMSAIKIGQQEIAIKNPCLIQSGTFQSLIIDLRKQASSYQKQNQFHNYGKKRVFVHGDFNPSNIICDNGKNISFIDFDNICRDDPVHDICRFLAHRGVFGFNNRSKKLNFLTEGQNFDSLFEFIRGYMEQSASYDRVRSLIPSTVSMVSIELLMLGFMNGSFSADHLSEAQNLSANIFHEASKFANQL